MKTKKIKKVGYSKALIAYTAALCCLGIYILSCVLSPPAWSPDSSKVAVLVTVPSTREPVVFAIFTYDLATEERVMLDEVLKDGVLSAPAWSPDGNWIAYYRIEPSTAAEPNRATTPEPNMAAAKELAAEPCTDQPEKKTESEGQLPTPTENLFSEENLILPGFPSALPKKQIELDEDLEVVDVKLIVVSADGKERENLCTFPWIVKKGWREEDDKMHNLELIKPEWSIDSRRIFYARSMQGLYCICSLDLGTDEKYLHLIGSIGTPSVSPDGKWVATLLHQNSEECVISIARIDGHAHKYFKLDLHIEDEDLVLNTVMSWSPDSEKILIASGDKLCIFDQQSGACEKYEDPNAESTAYGAFSEDGNKFYYLAARDTNDPNSDEEVISLKYRNLKNRKVGTLFELSESLQPLKRQGVGKFSISPDGKSALLRCVIEDEGPNERAALLFWNEQGSKIVETNRWMFPFTEDDLIFEEKLLGEWTGKNGNALVCRRADEKTYKLTHIEDDGDKQYCTAIMIKKNELVFLGIFMDESSITREDFNPAELLPDVFLKVYQIQPKLLLGKLSDDYSEVIRILKTGVEPQKPKDEDIEYEFEGIRASKADSNAISTSD